MKKLLSLCTIALMCFVSYSFGQKGITNLTDTLPVDPNVVIGKLDNGITYYIRKNSKPEKRVELRLAINAGSVLENKSQLGLAHFTEHMCFNGTKTFPGNQMVDYMQKHGMSFGGDLNAYTSFDETVYMLQVPTDNKNFMDTAVQILRDWAGDVTFDDKEIEKERGVITEEWRLGLGADDRMRKKWFPVAFNNSLYAERLPIGDIDVIKTFPHDTIRAFYKSWYRPNLEAVAIVGDIDVAEMTALVKKLFGDLKNPANPRPRVKPVIADNKDPLISVVTDKEATNSMVLMAYKKKAKESYTVADYKDQLTAELFIDMLNARFEEITLKADAPFIMAQADYGNFLARATDAYELYAFPKENQFEKSIETLILENERVKKFGFTSTELERMKEQMLTNYDKAAKEYDKTESRNLVGEYVRNFLRNEPIPGAKIENKLAKKLIPEITLDEINALAVKWITDDNLAVVLTGPEKDGDKMPTEKQILEVIAKAKVEKVDAYVDKFKTEPLVSEVLTGTKVTTKTVNKDLDYTELTFGNGVKAIIKKTEFKNDEILISAYSLGGLSLYPDKDFVSAYYASSVINESGVGNFDNTELGKKLKGKDIDISPYIDDLKEGFSGKCSPDDFETLLQLTYLYCKSPRKDTAAFRAFMEKMKTQYKFIGANPVYTFYDTLYKSASGNSPRAVVIPNAKLLDKVDLDVAYKVFSERFANANDFRFFIVGNVDVDSITPMLEEYLGSLPSTKKGETWVDNTPKFPAGITEIEVAKGKDQKSMVGILFDEKFEWTDNNRLALQMAKDIISIRLIEVIREAMSGVYSPQTQLSVDKYPTPEFSLMVMFGCSPKNTSKLTKAVFSIMKSLRDKGPLEKDLEKAKEALLRKREVDMKTNRFWLSRLESYAYNGDDVSLITDYNNKINAITAKDIQNIATKYFIKDHYVRVVLKPEKKK